MNKKIQQEENAVIKLRNMHISWIFIPNKDRKNYNLNEKIAFYHASSDSSAIEKIILELKKLGFFDDKDFFVHETKMDNSLLTTIGITLTVEEKLSNLGLVLTPKLS